MEKQVNGVITNIGFGNIFQGTYGDTAPCMVTINNEVYSCFVKPYNGQCRLQVKKGDNYIEVQNGMHVIFDATSNEKEGKTYWNFKSSGITILASGSASQPPQSTNAPQPTHSATATTSVAKNGDMDGFCEGLAKLIAAYKFQGKQMPPQDQIDRVANYIKKIFG